MLENLDLEFIKEEIGTDLMVAGQNPTAVEGILIEQSPKLKNRSDSPSFWARVQTEFRVFLCTEDKRYETVRIAFRKAGHGATPALMGLLSGTIATAIGGGVLLSTLIPFVALLLWTAITIGVGVYCKVPSA